jgi:DNA ligase (NAD+)
VVVKRAGEVIPQVVGPVREKRTGAEKEFEWPKECPVCGAPVEHTPGVAMAYCTNRDCPAQRFESLNHFVCQGGMDIRGLGAQTLRKLLELNLIRDAADLYALTDEQLAQLPGFKEKSVANLRASIEQSKGRPFARVLFALGIRHVGERVAELLASNFGDIDRLAAAPEAEIATTPGIGPEIARSIREYFEIDENLDLLRRMKTAGLRMAAGREAQPRPGVLSGKTFVITGTLPSLSREAATELIEAHGGKVTSSVSARTDFLLAGEGPGSKLQKAVELGVRRISEEELRSMTGGAS